MSWQEDADEIVQVEPIVAKKDCKVEVTAAESATWKVKDTVPGHGGEEYRAMKLTLLITDPDVQTEHEGSRPRLTLDHQLNLDRYPYLDKKSGTVKMLGRNNLYDLEEALGFDPMFQDAAGNPIEPFVTRTGRKVAPKGEGNKRVLNPAFLSAYFTGDGAPNLEWAGKTLYADIGVERSEQYGDKNTILRFKRPPVTV